jgi:dTDP-4-amino-4,6-dideoxygalactose transaminase
MEVLNKHISLRRENNKFYEEIFKCINGIKVFKEPNLDFFSNYWLSCIHIKKEIAGFDRKDLRLELLKNNIESRPLWKPMHLQPIFKESPFYGSNISEDLFNNGLCLPSGSNLTGDDKRRIKSVITNFVKDIQK